ncbi:hypothetical protein D3875_19860 [Deinococcus cavernae]|uniref:Uncharacterized protein n=1 Tax=Deinococcus cavernae TaxID=2320857 RepID=A0A418VBF4_9DEIO|nr:hypothetical protein [Deinococcus cavernae]RJF73463.1 hypothetical protein D3875_19860 [Deinococcus cavernae]
MPNAELLVCHMLTDLKLTLPDDFEWSVSQDAHMVYTTFRSGKLRSTSGIPLLNSSRCEVAERVVSNVQDFMADTSSVWWPQLAEQRLQYEIDCLDDRPRLIFRL